MQTISELRIEAQHALQTIWFLQAVQEIERTDKTINLRLLIRPGLFVQVFLGERSGSLYMALIEGERRIFGIDRERGKWHLHPYGSPDQHLPMIEEFEPAPLLRFLTRVEEVLLDSDLL